MTLDVISLFTNIPQDKGTECAEKVLNQRENIHVPSEYIISVLKLILKNNIFSFSDKLYSQEEGTSMGPRHSPHLADVFMAGNIDPQIEQIFQKYESENVDFMKRFLDDIFKVFIGSVQDLHKILDEINLIHPSIKFTMSHTMSTSQCDCPYQE